ncbi:beta-lactamase [Massilia sp. PAMC28688]|uniref:class C beta-lactamase n=1 Tax=Massilia sp. PAMC28688 TaxID=2861283 RepID=UPI001C635E98|nr:class C beta-lactamase [Massilia sp. PAMC28688]QYF94203.1 beta-lactamase [Massilia sp. PAMC28688]
MLSRSFLSRSAAAAACLLSINALAAEDSAKIRTMVDAIVQPLMAQQDIPGMAVGIAVGGQSYVFNYGVASKEPLVPVRDATMFELGSISKPIAAILGSHAQASGKLSLDDHPGQYMAQLKGTAIDKASLLHLATYTAGGLPQQFPDDVDEARLLAYFQKWKPDAEPGVQRRYSNPSLGLFGHLVALAMGGDYAELTAKHVFTPLGFTGTYFAVPAAAMPNYAWGYDSRNRPVRMHADVLAGPIYGVVATASDMLRLVQANIDPGALPAATRRAIEGTHVGYFKVGPMVQGLGWEQYPYPLPLATLVAGNSPAMNAQANPAQHITPPRPPRPSVLFSKTGGTRGFNSYVGFVPEKKIGVVLLANKSYEMKARITAAHALLEQLSKAP